MKKTAQTAKTALIRAILTALACGGALFASESITSYSSPVTVNDFLKWGDTMWVATSGGLRLHDLKSDAREMLANSSVFPDLHLTALCRDERGDIWIGSRRGYLYRMTPRGQFTTYSNYKISGWGITSLYIHEDLIVVGTAKGVSLFDPVRGVALRNASQIANFSNPRVNTIEVYRDTLFLGCENGVAYLDSLWSVPLSSRNFYDAGIWKTRRLGPVRAFVRAGDTLSAHSEPAAELYGWVIVAADSGWLTNGGRRLRGSRITPWGTIQKLFNEGGRRLWIGTLDGFYYSWTGEIGEGADGTPVYYPPEQHPIGGMTLRRASRVIAGPDGNIWFLPMVPYPNLQRHHGIYKFDGSHWYLFNDYTHPGRFGYIGDNNALGGTAAANGTFWAGMSGGNIKHIIPAQDNVAQLIVGNADFQNFGYVEYGDGDIEWGKSDALAQDSSGYLWVSVYDSNLGSLICYDPRYRPVSAMEHDPVRARYRRFFTEAPYKTKEITALSVDADGRIFAYDAAQNRLTIFSHGGNPLANGITVNASFTNYGTVSSIVTGEDGTTYIAGTNGLRKVSPGAVNTEAVDSALASFANITSLAVRGSVLWLGTRTNGILRFGLARNEYGERDSVWINESSGLPSNEVRSISLDGKGGRLWIVTAEGISQLDVGRGNKPSNRSKSLRAFPNVFSVSRSAQGVQQITFEGLESGATVSVYTLNGSLAAKAAAQPFNGNEWRAYWTPRRSLTPGTYIAVAKPSGKRTKIILKP
ncbi:MAG: hypothetical protein FWB85_07575 [Chitinispirillia bacterium]|nr:hypothetical protein [Chitinispirillia bacterium]MCL2242131.1 hypothetical protein [Chitinispirillia bacterium]